MPYTILYDDNGNPKGYYYLTPEEYRVSGGSYSSYVEAMNRWGLSLSQRYDIPAPRDKDRAKWFQEDGQKRDDKAKAENAAKLDEKIQRENPKLHAQIHRVVAPVFNFSIEDQSRAINDFDKWLREITGNIVSLGRLRNVGQNVPFVSNIISATDLYLGIKTLVDNPKLRSDVFEWIDLGLDAMGTLTGSFSSVGRNYLRVACHQMREYLGVLIRAELKEDLLVWLLDHLDLKDDVALEKWINEIELNVQNIVDDTAKKCQVVIGNLAKGLSEAVERGQIFDSAAEVRELKNILHKNANLSVRNLQKYTNGIDLLKQAWTVYDHGKANLAFKGALNFTDDADRKKFINTIRQLEAIGKQSVDKIKALGKPEEIGSIVWLLHRLILMINKWREKNPRKRLTSASNQKTTSHERKQPATENESSRAREAAPKNSGGCKQGVKDGTSCNINFILGNERVQHIDFSIGNLNPIRWQRQYSSNFNECDQGPQGARWITPYSIFLLLNGNEIVFFDEDGRKHNYQVPNIGQKIINEVELHVLTRLSETMISIEINNAITHVFESQVPEEPNHYRLVCTKFKDEATIGLLYEHVVEGKSILSDVVSKVAGNLESHVHTQVNEYGQIIALYEVKENKINRLLSSYNYDSHGDLLVARDDTGHFWQYQYSYHLLTRYADRTGRSMMIDYDGISANSKAIREWADDGSFDTQLFWDPNFRVTTVIDAHANVSQYFFDILGYIYKIIHEDGRTEWIYRDQNKNIVKRILPNAVMEFFSYDEKQNLVFHERPDGSTVHYQYDDDDNLIGIADGESNIWKRDYDIKGNLIEEIDPLGNKTEYEYNKLNLPILITDAKGGQKQLAYTPQGQLASYTDCSGKTTTWSYDDRGRLIKQTNAAGETTLYTYGQSGRNAGYLESITHPDGAVERFMHDAEGRLLTHIDPLERSTNYRYSIAGLVAERIDAAGHELTYTYDKLGRLIRLDNENNKAYHFKYDPVGRLLEEVGFDGKSTQYRYGQGNGVLESMIEGNTVSKFEFDPMGRLESRTAAVVDANRQTVLDKRHETFNYDGNGRLIMATNDSSKLQWFYDDAGNLEREHQEYKLKGHAYTAIWRHEYDELGNRIKTIRPDGHTVELMTYGSGHVHGVMLDDFEAIAFERDDLHREIERTQGNRLVQSLSYDRAGRLKEQVISSTQPQGMGNQQALSVRKYAYDAAGQLVNINDQRRGGLSYRYDPIGRLLEANSSLGKELFAFDPAGNIEPVKPSIANEHPNQPHQTQPANDALVTKAHPILDNLLRNYVGTHYEYDERGNMVKRIHQGQTTVFKWDAVNRLIESSSPQVRTRYYYDALGRRLAKHSEGVFNDTGMGGSSYEAIERAKLKRQHNLGFTLYGWDGDTLAWESTFDRYQDINTHTGQVGGFMDDSRTTHYVYEPNSFVPMVQATQAGAISLLPTPDYQAMIHSPEGYDIDRDPVWSYQAEDYIRRFDAVAYYQCDHLGTPQELTDHNGEIVWAAEYKAWGQAHEAITRAAKQAGIKNPIRFQGQYYDHETGLHYNRHRYYDPHSGRFVSKDPIGLEGGMNVHAYAPNPVEWIDPLGLWTGQPRSSNGRFGQGKDPNKAPAPEKSCTHGNSLDSDKPAIGYTLRDRATNEVLKYGETTRGAARYTKAYLDSENADFQREVSGTKREMHCWQTKKIREYTAIHGQRPRLNKTDY